jgi:hypothetical protein
MPGRDFTYEPDQTKGSTAGALVRAEQPRGELVTMPRVEPVSLRDQTFAKSGLQRLSARATKILRKPFHERREVEILTTGEVYVSHIHVRRRLNDAVGPMAWALRPVSEVDIKTKAGEMYREFALIVLGRVVATAFGSARYYADSARMDFADTAEAVKSNALTRCCKDLGIASECWDREWCDDWREKYAVHVWVVEKKRAKENGQWVDKKETNARWRKVTAKPLKGEIDIVHDSPNQDHWRKQTAAWAALLEAEAAKSKDVAERMQKARRDLQTVKKEEKAAETGTPKASGGESRTVDPEPVKTSEVVSTGAPPKPPGSTQHTAASGVDAKDRPFLIRNCAVVTKEPDFTLHKVTMLNGDEYFTFSSRVYGEMQKYLASREPIHIYAKPQTSKGRRYDHIAEWKELRTGVTKQ